MKLAMSTNAISDRAYCAVIAQPFSEPPPPTTSAAPAKVPKSALSASDGSLAAAFVANAPAIADGSDKLFVERAKRSLSHVRTARFTKMLASYELVIKTLKGFDTAQEMARLEREQWTRLSHTGAHGCWKIAAQVLAADRPRALNYLRPNSETTNACFLDMLNYLIDIAIRRKKSPVFELVSNLAKDVFDTGMSDKETLQHINSAVMFDGFPVEDLWQSCREQGGADHYILYMLAWSLNLLQQDLFALIIGMGCNPTERKTGLFWLVQAIENHPMSDLLPELATSSIWVGEYGDLATLIANANSAQKRSWSVLAAATMDLRLYAIIGGDDYKLPPDAPKREIAAHAQQKLSGHAKKVAALEERLAAAEAELNSVKQGLQAKTRALADAEKAMHDVVAERDKLKLTLETETVSHKDTKSFLAAWMNDGIAEPHHTSNGPQLSDNELATLRGVIVGGHKNWHDRIRKLMPHVTFLSSERNAFDPRVFASAKFAFFFVEYCSHKLVGKAMLEVKKHRVPSAYIASTNQTRFLEALRGLATQYDIQPSTSILD